MAENFSYDKRRTYQLGVRAYEDVCRGLRPHVHHEEQWEGGLVLFLNEEGTSAVKLHRERRLVQFSKDVNPELTELVRNAIVRDVNREEERI